MDDHSAWKKYPKHRKWFNKLYVSDLLGYNCGPCGVAPEKDGWYIVRPIYNLSGMSLGAEKKYIKANDVTQVQPGYFWCEWFNGDHVSVTYRFIHDINPYWKPIKGWKGYSENFKFTKWERVHEFPIVPRALNELSFTDINVEFINGNVIEVHMRDTPDPEYDEMIPIFISNVNDIDILKKLGYNLIESPENGDGWLEDPRVGFMVRNK